MLKEAKYKMEIHILKFALMNIKYFKLLNTFHLNIYSSFHHYITFPHIF